MWVGQAGLDDSDWLFDTGRCPPRGLSRRQCVAVPLKATRTIPSVITHNAHAHYAQHKQVDELPAYCTIHNSNYTFALLFFLLLYTCSLLYGTFNVITAFKCLCCRFILLNSGAWIPCWFVVHKNNVCWRFTVINVEKSESMYRCQYQLAIWTFFKIIF